MSGQTLSQMAAKRYTVFDMIVRSFALDSIFASDLVYCGRGAFSIQTGFFGTHTTSDGRKIGGTKCAGERKGGGCGGSGCLQFPNAIYGA